MRQLPKKVDPNVIVGANTVDDAGVYHLDRDRALVQTVDFFTPIVDDPYAYGQIAAANALSDVYAMGGRPLTALNIVGMPQDLLSPRVIGRILKGGAAIAKKAGCPIIGGHSIRNPEPIYGLAVTGLIHPTKLMTNAKARPGDQLVLTKPIGFGIIATAIKKGMASQSLIRTATDWMCRLNSAGAVLAEKGLVRAGTDVTGFGLLGHLSSMCQSSQVGAEICAEHVPVLNARVSQLIEEGCVPGGTEENLRAVEGSIKWHRVDRTAKLLLADAQTSGGLLLSVSPRHLTKVIAHLNSDKESCAAVIGSIVRSGPGKIRVIGKAHL